MKVIYLFAVIFLFSCYGCENYPTAPDVSLNNDFNIKYGESVYIPQENLYITFSDVVEDSRCPIGLMCFWEGTAKIKLLISKGTKKIIDTVQTYLPQKIISIGEINNSYLFRVKKVVPYPKENERIDKRDYVLTLNVTHFTYGFSDSEIGNKTGIFGQVFISPITPVERLGYISYKPFSATFKIVDNREDSTIVHSDSTGKFIAYLPPGEYHLVPNKGLPIFSDTTKYTVTEGKMTFVKVFYNNPIR